jgi:hypothetical protein
MREVYHYWYSGQAAAKLSSRLTPWISGGEKWCGLCECKGLDAAKFDHVSDSPSLSIKSPVALLPRKIQLPRNAEAVIQPAKAPTEAVVVQWHQHLTTFRKCTERAFQFGLRLEFNEGRA